MNLNLLFATEAAPADVPAWATMLPQVLIIGAFIAVFYFMMIRPQNKQRKAREQMLKDLKVGDRVKTIGGIYGRICELQESTITIEVGRDKVRLVFDRSAVGSLEGADPESEETLNS